MMFQCPAVGTGLLIIAASITTGLFNSMARLRAGLNSSAAVILLYLSRSI
ncbi:hypothetical protein [Pelosinus fermentans]|nr:hypothetical protein [Pelosinus fermentans]